MTTSPVAGAEPAGQTLIYDGWNRLTHIEADAVTLASQEDAQWEEDGGGENQKGQE